jgi:hypothetical protein
MATASKVVSIAAGQVGYKEGRNNSNKYGAAYGMNNVSWCMEFIWWCMKQAGMDWYKTASCTACYKHYASRAVSRDALRKGDIVFFDWDHSGDCDHVGIVESVGSSRITTIEGNTSSGNAGSQSNGDGVYRRYRTRSQIAKAIRPAYEAETSGGGTCNVTVQEVKNGSKGGSVYVLQAFLKAKGYYTGKVDGEAGSLTEKAIKAFQKAMGLSQDGIAGQKTWAAVFK